MCAIDETHRVEWKGDAILRAKWDGNVVSSAGVELSDALDESWNRREQNGTSHSVNNLRQVAAVV